VRHRDERQAEGGIMTDLAGKTFVLCHGAWHGAWCWCEIAAALRARGAEVHTPTMTGMGERRHLRDAFKGVSTYVEDVCTVIEVEGLRDIVLVGHSFGGMCISGVADRMPDRVRRLVYLDAAVPRDGDSMATQSIAFPPKLNAAVQQEWEARAHEWLPPPSLDLIGVADAPEWVRARELACMTDFPALAFVDRLHFVNGGPKAPATYVVCDNPPMPNTSFVAHYEQVVAGHYGPHWTARRIDTGHMCMFTAPDETIAMLTEAALA
jgi:pimeloyl-ACP methyl ester carboxylesterase